MTPCEHEWAVLDVLAGDVWLCCLWVCVRCGAVRGTGEG